MSTVIHETQSGCIDYRDEASDEDVRSQVWSVLNALYPRGAMIERRHENRYPYPYLVRLAPVGTDGHTPLGESIVVVGKHLSERGLGFYHPKPIPHRRMIATLEISGVRSVAFLIDLSWCRFTRHGWYESGGKFLEAIASALPTRQRQ